MRRAQRIPAILALGALLLGTSAARADERVIVLSVDPTPTPGAGRTAEQLEHELAAEGFSVVRARESDAARRLRAERGLALVRIEGSPTTGAIADVWISGRDGGRRFREKTDPEGRTLSLRVLEYVRASLIELEPAVPAAPVEEEPPASGKSAIEDDHVGREAVAVAAAVGALAQLEGAPVRFGGALGARFRLMPQLFLEARLARGTSSHIEHKHERASLTETWATVGVRLTLVQHARVGAFLGAGLGAYYASSEGQARPPGPAGPPPPEGEGPAGPPPPEGEGPAGPPHENRSDSVLLPLAMLGVGSALHVFTVEGAAAGLFLRFDAALTSADLSMRFADEVVTRFGRLLIFPSFGAEVSW